MDDVLHSVVVPVFNEAEVIHLFHDRCLRAMAAMTGRFEIVYVDDGSSDGTWERLAEYCASDSRIRAVRLSRNFGHQVAITAGLEFAAGDTVTTIDADLQDPPEVIGEMVGAWLEGADVVYGVRDKRQGEGWFKVFSASVFYRFINSLSTIDLPVDAGDFRLLSRRAVDALLSMPEEHRYVRGLVAWIGYPTTSVHYVREARAAGTTRYPFSKMVRLATDGIVAFSTRPLRLATWLGLGVSAGAFVTATVLAVMRLAGGIQVEGWTSLAVLLLLMSGVQLLTIGALGEYVGRTYSEVRRRPLYLLREVRGVEPDDRRSTISRR